MLLFQIINILLMNVIFHDFWSTYIEALSLIPAYNWLEWNKQTSRVFPKMAKCDFMKYGHSQTMETRDILCLLPLNILNEKIFAFLYCWFILLGFLSIFNIVYRGIFFCSSSFRIHLIRTHTRFLTTSQVRVALRKLHIGDLFMLFKVSSNINPLLFRDLIQEMYDLQRHEGNNHVKV